MPIEEELRRILTIISDMTQNDIQTKIKDSKIIAEVNRPSAEVEKQLDELELLGLIEQDKTLPSDREYKIYKITRQGIKEVYNKEFR